MEQPEYLMHLFDYNYWANERMIETASTLTPEHLFLEHPHSWGSVHSMLVHMMSTEWVWLQRWKGESPPASFLLEDYPTLAAVRKKWREIEAEMRAFLAEQTTQSLQREITYTDIKGQMYTLELWQLGVHVANHGTHHRGELAAMFASMDAPHPEDDLLKYFQIMSDQIQA